MFKTEIAGFEIKMEQAGPPNKRAAKHSFRVTYGKQVSPMLTYGQAAISLAHSIMHALSCEGKIEDDLR